MAIAYTATSILITDDGNASRPLLRLPLDATSEEIAAAHASYSTLVPEPDYVGFYSGLLSSLTYQSVVVMPATAEQVKAMVVFVAQIQEAMAGRVSPPTLQGAIWLLLGQVALTQANATELSMLMAKHHLAGTYALAPAQ